MNYNLSKDRKSQVVARDIQTFGEQARTFMFDGENVCKTCYMTMHNVTHHDITEARSLLKDDTSFFGGESKKRVTIVTIERHEDDVVNVTVENLKKDEEDAVVNITMEKLKKDEEDDAVNVTVKKLKKDGCPYDASFVSL